MLLLLQGSHGAKATSQNAASARQQQVAHSTLLDSYCQILALSACHSARATYHMLHISFDTLAVCRVQIQLTGTNQQQDMEAGMRHSVSCSCICIDHAVNLSRTSYWSQSDAFLVLSCGLITRCTATSCYCRSS